MAPPAGLPSKASQKSDPIRSRMRFIDSYFSSSTGHQIADGVGKRTQWRDHRALKTKNQLLTNNLHFLTANTTEDKENLSDGNRAAPIDDSKKPIRNIRSQLFNNCTIYVNASTISCGISDIEFKRLVSAHGAQISLHLARRRVTHVILSKPDEKAKLSRQHVRKNVQRAVGCALAASKIEKEIISSGRMGIKYVSVEWVLESIKAGKRLPEGQFPVVRLAMQIQKQFESSSLVSMEKQS